jgi:hypothetical protein
MANALKAPGQDVLKESVQKRFGSEFECARLSLVVAVREGDVSSIVAHNAFCTQGGAINVSGQIFQRRFATSDLLDIGDPPYRPDRVRNVAEQSGMMLPQCGFETGTKARGQGGLRQEVIRVFWANPAQLIFRESAAGQDAMDVGMVMEVARPGLQDGQTTQLCAEVLVSRTDIDERGSPGGTTRDG